MPKTIESMVTAERWSGLRLWVYRSNVDYAPAAVLVRTAGRGLNQDRMVCRGQAYIPPGSSSSKSALHALLAALVACYGSGLTEAALADVLAAEPLRGPRGGFGGEL